MSQRDPTRPTLRQALGDALVVAVVAVVTVKAAPVLFVLVLVGLLASCVL